MLDAMSMAREDVLMVADVAALLDLKPYPSRSTPPGIRRLGSRPHARRFLRPELEDAIAGFRSRIVSSGRGEVACFAIGGAQQARHDLARTRDVPGDLAQRRGVIAVEVDDHPHLCVWIGRKPFHERRTEVLQFSVELPR